MSKVVLITGASSGIGKSTATYLSKKGYKVYGTSRNPKNLEEFSFQPFVTDSSGLMVIGDAMDKMRTSLEEYEAHLPITYLEAYPNAEFMGSFIQYAFDNQAFESLVSFEPNYIKPVYITPPKS